MNRFKILLPAAALLLLLGSAVPAFAAPPGPTIVDVAIAVNEETGEFSTLIAAVLAADPAVLATLSGNGQFTVFAPTDAAFDELGFDADNIGDLDQGALTQILLYHVARGRRNSNGVLGSRRINTLQGGFLMQSNGVLTDNRNAPRISSRRTSRRPMESST